MSELPKGWIEYKLGEIYTVSSGLSKGADQFGFGHTFISFKDVFWNTFLPKNPEGLVNSTEKDQDKGSVLKGDILLTRTSESLDEVGMSSVALKNYPNSTFNGFSKRLRVKSDAPIKVSPLFMGFLLRTRFFRKTVANYSTMTTRASLNAKSIESIPLAFPPFEEQDEIGLALYSFNKKIELLREQNETLETLAQTLFKEWFVNFNYPNATGEMVDSEFGEIPKGWRVGKLGDYLVIKRGGSPRPIKDFISDSGYRWLKISDASATKSPYILKIKEHIKVEGLSKTTLLKKGALVLSNSATPGIPKFLEVDSCVHDGWLHFPSTSVFSYNYLYLLFLHIRKPLLQQGSGSVFKNLKTDILKAWKVVIPDTECLKSFEDCAIPIFEKIKNNAHQIQDLSKARDTLLPKLLNGSVRVEGFGEI